MTDLAKGWLVAFCLSASIWALVLVAGSHVLGWWDEQSAIQAHSFDGHS